MVIRATTRLCRVKIYPRIVWIFVLISIHDNTAVSGYDYVKACGLQIYGHIHIELCLKLDKWCNWLYLNEPNLSYTSICRKPSGKNTECYWYRSLMFWASNLRFYFQQGASKIIVIVKKKTTWTTVRAALKLYCGYKYTRPCMINRIWGLKQLWLQVNGHAWFHLHGLRRPVRNREGAKNSKWKYMSPAGFEPTPLILFYEHHVDQLSSLPVNFERVILLFDLRILGIHSCPHFLPHALIHCILSWYAWLSCYARKIKFECEMFRHLYARWYGDVRLSLSLSDHLSDSQFLTLFCYTLWHNWLTFCVRLGFMHIRISSRVVMFSLFCKSYVYIPLLSDNIGNIQYTFGPTCFEKFCFHARKIKFECSHFLLSLIRPSSDWSYYNVWYVDMNVGFI